MSDTLIPLRDSIERIYRNLHATGQRAEKSTGHVHPEQRQSVLNLMHYLALRCEDLRAVQDDLHKAGLSSLASSESHVLRQVQAVLERLGVRFAKKELSSVTYDLAAQILKQRTLALFGKKPNPAIPHLMVTFDTHLAHDYSAVKALLRAGMNVARINCAHDSPADWKKMAANVRKAARTSGQPCRIYLDLAGPKIRTVLLGKGAKKGRMKIRPQERFLLAETDALFNKTDKVIGCTLPGVVKDLRPGDRVLFDDGLFEAEVEHAGILTATLLMTRVSAPKGRIKPKKGMNFPDTELTVRSLTEFDQSVLPFARDNADIVGFSFVRNPADVAELQHLLRRPDGTSLPLVLKIETAEAVQSLPALMLQGMAEPVFGVMIARGDLAVEIGFERLSEIQEEILWLCEAAHVPVIWATQVLETLNKSGIATRSEVTDAAHAAHAECVMLNKGKHLLTVMATLQDILQRSGGHHLKKRYVFRSLRIAERFLERL